MILQLVIEEYRKKTPGKLKTHASNWRVIVQGSQPRYFARIDDEKT